MQSTSRQAPRCAAVIDGPYPRLWEMRVLATLAKSGLAKPVAIWRSGSKPGRGVLQGLFRRQAGRRAASLAPMTKEEETLGLPVVSTETARSAATQELDILLDFRADAGDLTAVPQARLGRWELRIGSGGSRDIIAALLEAYCSAAPAIDVALMHCEPAGAERVLFSGRLARRPSLIETVDAVLMNVADAYEGACRRLLAGQPLPMAAPARSAPPVTVSTFVAAWLRGRLRSLRARWSIEIWNIGIAPRPSFEALAQGGTIAGVKWLPHPPDPTFRADPFGWSDAEGRIAIAHEHFDYRAGKGTLEIARLTLPSTEPAVEPLADLPVHASYPYLMPMPGLLLCLPELNESGRTLLFKIETAPARLTYVATLLDDVPLSDGTIFRFGEHHWLFGTRADRDSQLRLYAWFSGAVDGPWTPHALNPIKCDITSARPAGTPFWAGGSLFRPAQDCSRSYGGAIALNRIVELTPTSFREETVARILPDLSGPYPDGLHTLSFVGDWLLIDGKRHLFRWDAAALNRNFVRRRAERQAKFRARTQ